MILGQGKSDFNFLFEGGVFHEKKHIDSLMKKNKIKYIKIITYGNFPYGGASANYLRHFAKGLTALDYDIEVLLPTGQYYRNNIEKVENRLSNCENIAFKISDFIRYVYET